MYLDFVIRTLHTLLRFCSDDRFVPRPYVGPLFHVQTKKIWFEHIQGTAMCRDKLKCGSLNVDMYVYALNTKTGGSCCSLYAVAYTADLGNGKNLYSDEVRPPKELKRMRAERPTREMIDIHHA